MTSRSILPSFPAAAFLAVSLGCAGSSPHEASRASAALDSGSTRTTELRFTSVDSGRFERTMPGVSFEFGRGDGAAVDGPAMGRGRTDEHGVAVVQVDAHAWNGPNSDLAWTWVRVDGDAACTEQWFRPDFWRWNVFVFVASPCSTFRGVVVDGEGRPIRADVGMAIVRDPYGSDVVRSVRSRADGTFALAYFGEPHVEVLARAPDVGAASRSFVELAGQLDDGPFRFPLRASGTLRGVVRDAAGRPMPDMELRACTAALCEREADLTRSESSLIYDREAEVHAAEMRGGGLADSMFRTDAQGAFEVRGLQSTTYHVLGRGQLNPFEFRHRLTSAPIPSDGTVAEIVHVDEFAAWIDLTTR